MDSQRPDRMLGSLKVNAGSTATRSKLTEKYVRCQSVRDTAAAGLVSIVNGRAAVGRKRALVLADVAMLSDCSTRLAAAVNER